MQKHEKTAIVVYFAERIISFRFDIQNVRQGTKQFSDERNCKHQYI